MPPDQTSRAANHSAWMLIVFCAIGLVLALCLGLYGKSLDPTPMYNLG